MQRVGLFIDVSNLYYCVSKKFDGRKVDYSKYYSSLEDNLPEGASLCELRAYGTKIEDEARSFIRRLNSLGFTTKFVRTTRTRSTALNVNIAMDIIRLLDNLDIIVLGTANREMIPLVNYLKEQGKEVYILACGICNELNNIASKPLEIDEDTLEVIQEPIK